MKSRCLLTVVLVFVLAAGVEAPVRAQEETGPEVEVKNLLDQARKLGAKGQLPLAWWDLDKQFDAARKEGADAATWEKLTEDATLLRNRAAFVDEMRKRKSGMEALLGRFDQALNEIAALYGVDVDPVLTGSARAAALIENLDRTNLRRQVTTDSLRVANRRLSENVGDSAVVQDSVITALQLEVTELRQQLWDTQLRVGVAEADRSAAESTLTVRQAREDQIAAVREDFTPEQAEILLMAGGDLVLRVHGLAFAVGSAEIQAGQNELVAKLAQTIARFPEAEVRVEGHTDDTGSRDANLRLSRRRAETIAVLLADHLGRSAESFATEGYGPDRPVALNSTAEGRALNRRIDVVISTPR